MATAYRENYMGTLPVSDTGAKLWLAANTELTWTVPGTSDQKYRANFRYSSNVEFWFRLNDTVVVPVAGTVVSTYNEEMLPEEKYVVGGDVLHFISTATPQIGVSLLSVPG